MWWESDIHMNNANEGGTSRVVNEEPRIGDRLQVSPPVVAPTEDYTTTLQRIVALQTQTLQTLQAMQRVPLSSSTRPTRRMREESLQRLTPQNPKRQKTRCHQSESEDSPRKCWNCREIGHIRQSCPYPRRPRGVSCDPRTGNARPQEPPQPIPPPTLPPHLLMPESSPEERPPLVQPETIRSVRICWNCGGPGHMRDKCPLPKIPRPAAARKDPTYPRRRQEQEQARRETHLNAMGRAGIEAREDIPTSKNFF